MWIFRSITWPDFFQIVTCLTYQATFRPDGSDRIEFRTVPYQRGIIVDVSSDIFTSIRISKKLLQTNSLPKIAWWTMWSRVSNFFQSEFYILMNFSYIVFFGNFIKIKQLLADLFNANRHMTKQKYKRTTVFRILTVINKVPVILGMLNMCLKLMVMFEVQLRPRHITKFFQNRIKMRELTE